MNARYQALAENIVTRFGGRFEPVVSDCGELTIEVVRDQLIDVATALRDDPAFCFESLIDLCAVDYLTWGSGEWKTEDATNTGFSRAAFRETILPEPDEVYDERRFAVVYHLLSVSLNHRLRLRVFTGSDNPPLLPSVIDVWAAASWYEREAFDLFGILFEGHPDLRRLLTDYGFIGHPFRKDFPISGNVEVRYDPVQGRVIYQPVTIEPRVLVPRIVRDDNRYSEAIRGRSGADDEHG